jgi:NADH pyrophosphatase NudC (nudix superfamily)
MENAQLEEMTYIIHNTWLPIMRGLDTIGETIISERDAARIANELIEANYVKQREGKWKLCDGGFGTCSACNFTQASVWDFDNYQRYCGHCGAKMSLEEKEEDESSKNMR